MSTLTGRDATVSVDVGGQEIVFETGKLAKQADGAVVVRSGDTMILATAVGRPDARPDADFFPLTVDVEERMYAAGQDPGRLLQAGRPGDRARDAHRPHDRPADQAALAEGVPQRGAGHLHRPLGRPGHTARLPLHQRRLGGADGLASALPGAGRRGSHRPDRRRVRRQPVAGGSRGARPSTSSSSARKTR